TLTLTLLPHSPPRLPHSSPTRRSSDLGRLRLHLPLGPANPYQQYTAQAETAGTAVYETRVSIRPLAKRSDRDARLVDGGSGRFRSAEHTSELQSQSNLVCRLLLEQKHNNYAPAEQGLRRKPHRVTRHFEDEFVEQP